MAEERGADIVFMPSIKDIYPIGYQTRVIVDKIQKPFEGECRPHFFEGVATVCTKLFNSVEPDEVFFGQKDYQQCLIIERLIKDLNMPIKFNMIPISREANGLAMSSRNRYMTPDEKEKAGIVFLTLEQARASIAKGERRRKIINAIMLKKLKELNEIKVDYVGSALAGNLETPEEFLKGDEIVLLIACYFNKTRLIDNMLIKV
jgi:pantoate--beta-alanine ligase